MSAGMALAAADSASLAAGVEVEFTDAGGMRRRERLGSCWDVRFEEAAPVRPFRWLTGQRHFPGWWWSATTGRLVGHESWLERDLIRTTRRVTTIADCHHRM